MTKTSKTVSYTLEPRRPYIESLEKSYSSDFADLNHNKLVGADGTVILISEEVFNVLKKAAPVLEERRLTVIITPATSELTTQQAADALNVSRPYLIKLLEQGEIPYVMVGSHRRIKREDFEQYKAKRDSQRRQSLDDLTEMMEEEGLFD